MSIKRQKNRLTTPAYFISRLRDNGYMVDRVFTKFGKADSRSWMVVVDPGGASVFITCLRNVDEYGANYFEMYDAGQYIPKRFSINTESIEVIITYLNQFNIISKTNEYNESGPKYLRKQKEQAAADTTTVEATDMAPEIASE